MNPSIKLNPVLCVHWFLLFRFALELLQNELGLAQVWSQHLAFKIPVYLLTLWRALIKRRYSSSFAQHSLKFRLISWSHNSCSDSSEWNLAHNASTDGWEIPTTWNHCLTDGIVFTVEGRSSIGIFALATNCLLKSLTSFPWNICYTLNFLHKWLIKTKHTSIVLISCWINSALVEHWVLNPSRCLAWISIMAFISKRVWIVLQLLVVTTAFLETPVSILKGNWKPKTKICNSELMKSWVHIFQTPTFNTRFSFGSDNTFLKFLHP